MKFCYHCGKITPDEPLFCNFCGRTYDVKLCTRLHPNGRYAEVCSQCGSRDFSTPQPRVPLWTRCFGWLLRATVALLLVYLALVSLALLAKGILTSPGAQHLLLSLGILAALLYWLWLKLPQWVRKLVHRMVGRKGGAHGR